MTTRADGGRPEQDGDAGREPAARELASARRLLRWYPRGWRVRYGEEFAELLAAELAEQGPSWRRSSNVAAAGLRARLAAGGVTGHPLDPAAAGRAGLATVATCTAVCVLAGGTMWAQLAVGLQWSVPRARGITQAMALMSGTLVFLALLAVLAAAPVAWAALLAFARGHGRPLLWPAALIVAGLAVLIAGGHHVENGWPGTGGHLLGHQGGVPGGVAAFGWAVTMWITSYRAHPSALAAFPGWQLAWMVLCPVAIGCLITGSAQLLRRVRLSPRAFRYQARIAGVACAGLVAFLAGALCWQTAAGGAEPVSLFQAGVIDRAGVAVLAVAVLCCAAAARQARAAARAACAR